MRCRLYKIFLRIHNFPGLSNVHPMEGLDDSGILVREGGIEDVILAFVLVEALFVLDVHACELEERRI